MNPHYRFKAVAAAGLGAIAIVLTGCVGTYSYDAMTVQISPTGSEQVPPVNTRARGKNGPVAIGLTRSSDALWVVPSGARFSKDQYKAFVYGETYVNFHTEANKGGEIRAQLLP